MIRAHGACLLEGAHRDVSQADRGGGQGALKRRTPIVTIAESKSVVGKTNTATTLAKDPYPRLDLKELPRDGWLSKGAQRAS